MIHRLACLTMVLVLAGCGEKPAPVDPTVFTIDGRSVPRSRLDEYFAANLLELPGETPGDPADGNVARSRVFDNFIDEELLLLEAERRGVAVSEREVDARIEQLLRLVGDDQPEDLSRMRNPARCEIMIQKLRAAVSFAEVTVTEREIDRYLEQHRAEMLPDSRAVLRFLTLKDEAEANRIRLEILRTGMDFAEAVEVFSADPSRTGPLELDLEILPEEVSRSLQRLQPGEVSRPVVFHGQTYLFALRSRGSAMGWSESELRERARREVLRGGTREVLDGLIARLREETTLVVNLEDLPFQYIPDR